MQYDSRSELMRYIGSMQQVAYVRPFTYREGRSGGMRAFAVKNDVLSFTVLADKCLDVAELSYKGLNFSFLSRPGLQGRGAYDTNGDEAIHSIMGGFFFTAGLNNICARCTAGGIDHPLHGRIRTTPAEHVCSDAAWVDGRYVISLSGEMREAVLFGSNLVLRRSIRSVLGEPSFTVTDTVINETHQPQPLMLLYHINIGYPLLEPGTEILLPTVGVETRDPLPPAQAAGWNRMDEPVLNAPEQVFIHEPLAGQDGRITACVINRRLQLGLRLDYTARYLPKLMEWKSAADGDYVIGLEPANSGPYGRAAAEADQTLHHIGPFCEEVNVLTFTVLDGAAAIAGARQAIESVQGRIAVRPFL